MIRDHSTLTDEVEKSIKEMIFSGALKPGERINQAQIAKEFNISRGPLREALRSLQREGIIHNVTNIGTFVTTLSEQDIFELYSLRGLLEEEAVRLALPRINDEVIAELKHILAGLNKAVKEKDLLRMAKYDISFHRAIVDHAPHNRLVQMHEQLDTQVGVMFYTVSNRAPHRIKQQTENHQVLIDALMTKDEAVVKKAFSDHYLETLNELLKEDIVKFQGINI